MRDARLAICVARRRCGLHAKLLLRHGAENTEIRTQPKGVATGFGVLFRRRRAAWERAGGGTPAVPGPAFGGVAGAVVGYFGGGGGNGLAG